MINNYTRIQLDNGLTVLLKEIPTAPIISQWVWYRVGSRNEVPGKTGISHWVEHMQFKATDQFPAGVLDKAISRDGGYWNALTFMDWTAYFETCPADKIDLAMRLEADRMINSHFDPAEVESERTVVMAEREGSENEPTFRLNEAVSLASYDRHPYRNAVIGSLADLASITRDDLYQHYRRYYVPANAILALAGDFRTLDMAARVRGYYQHIPATLTPIDPIALEGPLSKERLVEVKGPGETTYLRIVYRAPSGNDPDFFPFTLLDSLLSGPASLSMFGGGGISNKTSRLYRALVERELAVSVSGSLQATIDPGTYDLHITVRPDKSFESVLKAVDAEINRLQDSLITREEAARAVKQARALFAYSTENITNQAFWLGFSEIFSSYEWFQNFVVNLERITPEEIQRVAKKYLQVGSRVVGVYLPTGNAVEKEGQA